MAAEEGVKRIAKDIDIYRKRDDQREIQQSSNPVSPGSAGGDKVQRGTKDLMRMIRQGVDESNIEDAEIEE